MRQPCPVCQEVCTGKSAERSGQRRTGDHVSVRFKCSAGHNFSVRLDATLYALCRAARYLQQGAEETLRGGYEGAGQPEKATMEHRRVKATRPLVAALALRKAGRGWWE